jgi:hypothetical protein
LGDTYSQKWHTLVEGQVYLSKMTGYLTAENMHAFDRECVLLCDSSPFPLVHIIHDTRSFLGLPPLAEVRKIVYPFHRKMGFNITMGAFPNPLVGFMLVFATSIFRSRFQDVKTFREACAFLAEKDPSLPPISTWNIPSDADLTVS